MNTIDNRSAGSPEERAVLRLITRLNIGGPARQALLLTKELGPGWQTRLVAGTPGAQEGELADPEVLPDNVPFVRPISPSNDLRAFRAVRRLLIHDRPAIVHTHMAKAGAVGRLAATAMKARPKIVHTYHGHVLDQYFRPAAERAFIAIERWLARSSDVLIAISPEVKDSLLRLGIGRAEQYRTIPLGFDLSQHLQISGAQGKLRTLLRLPDDVQLIGSVGRLVPIKDLTTLVLAIARVPEVHLAILGDGESGPQLRTLVAELGLMERVHFTGWHFDIAGAMSDMDLVVLSSLNEGTPVSLIEAAACGKAVVATDVGGVRYVVDHERTGLLYPPREPDALAAGIRTLISDPDRRRRMGIAGREKARRLFHKDRLLADIRDLYEELLA